MPWTKYSEKTKKSYAVVFEIQNLHLLSPATLKPPKDVHMKIKSRASEDFLGFFSAISVSKVP